VTNAGDPRVGLDEVLMTLVVEFLFFLENTPVNDLDPSVAQRIGEEIGFQLTRLVPQELEPLIEFIRTQAAASAWPTEREFLEKLPHYLGWE
jgi:hypothetical protein